MPSFLQMHHARRAHISAAASAQSARKLVDRPDGMDVLTAFFAARAADKILHDEVIEADSVGGFVLDAKPLNTKTLRLEFWNRHDDGPKDITLPKHSISTAFNVAAIIRHRITATRNDNLQNAAQRTLTARREMDAPA